MSSSERVPRGKLLSKLGSAGNPIPSFCRPGLEAFRTYGSSFKFMVCEPGEAFGFAGVRDAGTKRDAGVDFLM